MCRASGKTEEPLAIPVITLPPALREHYLQSLSTTASVLADLFSSARRSLRILAPYVDPTFTGLVAAVRAPVEVLTTPAPGRPPRPNPVLERCSSHCDLKVRYLNERRDRVLIFQMHAKAIIADGERAYVGSANLTDTSVNYNLELGLLVDDSEVVASLTRLFDYLFQHVAVPPSRLS